LPTLPLLTSPPKPTNYRLAGDTPLKQLPHNSRRHLGGLVTAPFSYGGFMGQALS